MNCSPAACRSFYGFLAFTAVYLLQISAGAAAMSDPAVDAYNLRVGTQTFAPEYKFTTNSKLVETAEAIRAMGSDAIKFYLGRNFSGQYGISLSATITNLTELAKREPSCRQVMDMPFRHVIVWAYCFTPGGDTYWKDGLSVSERQREYTELNAFARYLLTNYNNSGKSFYFGHWEGDWYLLENYQTTNNPAPGLIQGMIDWLNTRQQAVDDALRDTPHTNVQVYVYAEANRVRDAMVNPATSNQRLINKVVPYVTNLDLMSWSSYDGMNLSRSDLFATLNYIQSQLPTNKAPRFTGRRVFIGEYGWGGSLSSAAQEPRTRTYIQALVEWGCPFVLFWEIYNNEPGKAYWLIDNTGAKTPCYDLHQRYYNRARLLLGEFRQNNNRLPNDAEFASLVTPMLNQPLPAPVNLQLSNAATVILSSNAARVTGALRQGIYGEDWAQVRLFYGTNDGGTIPGAWATSIDLGTNSRFGTASFSAVISNVPPETRVYYRFYATNSAGAAWTDYSGRVRIPEAPVIPANLVPPRSAWKYRDDGINLGTAWRANAFNDATW